MGDTKCGDEFLTQLREVEILAPYGKLERASWKLQQRSAQQYLTVFYSTIKESIDERRGTEYRLHQLWSPRYTGCERVQRCRWVGRTEGGRLCRTRIRNQVISMEAITRQVGRGFVVPIGEYRAAHSDQGLYQVFRRVIGAGDARIAEADCDRLAEGIVRIIGTQSDVRGRDQRHVICLQGCVREQDFREELNRPRHLIMPG